MPAGGAAAPSVRPTLAPAGAALAVLAAVAGAAASVPLWVPVAPRVAAWPGGAETRSAAGTPGSAAGPGGVTLPVAMPGAAVTPGAVVTAGGAVIPGGLLQAPASPASPAAGAPRLVAVVADLHLGPGRDEGGEWRAAEDFRWADEFALFLDALDAEGGGDTDLVLNGDTFDLTRPADAGCDYEDPALGCTETEALARLERVLAAHADVIDALAAFAASGANRVILVPGEHDAALLFPAVAQRVELALDAPEGRAEVAAAGAWTSNDGQIHIEHGHQIGWRVDRFEAWPDPFVERDGRRHLARPERARAVDGFFDALEARYPVIDNFADEGAGLTHGLAAEGTSDLGPQAAALLRYVLFRMPWQQFRVDLDAGDVQPPSWDLAAVRAQGTSFLVDSLPNDHRFKPLARQAREAGRLDALMAGLGDDELIALCDYRAASRRARRRFERVLTQFDPQGPPVRECPRHPDSRGGLFDYFWRTRDRIYADRLTAAEAGRPAGAPPIAVFVHNHTLLVDWRQRVLELTRLGRTVIVDGFSPVRNALAPVVINGGPWQRTITPVQFGRLRAEHGLSERELLAALRPEHLPPCYGFVRIDPYDEAPGLPAIRYWRPTEEGTGWEMAGTCGRQPEL